MNQNKAFRAFWIVALFWVLLFGSIIWIDLIQAQNDSVVFAYKVIASVAFVIPLSFAPLPKFESFGKEKIMTRLGSGLVVLSLIMLGGYFAFHRGGTSRFLLLGAVDWSTIGIWCVRISKK